MSADNVATNSLGLYNHWSLILNGYLGKECVHIKATKTIDLNGNVIDESQTETTIYAAISPIHENAIRESGGLIQVGDLIFYALAEEGVLVGTQTSASETRYDMIRYESVLYTVERKVTTAYDDGAATVSKFILRKIAYKSD